MTVHRHFIFLFAVLLLFLLFLPLLDPLAVRTSPRLVNNLLNIGFTGVLLAAFYGVSKGPYKSLLLLGIPAVLLGAYKTLHPTQLAFIVHDFCAMLLIGFVIVRLVIYLFRSTSADYNMICASLCAYLMLGLFWAMTYSCLAEVDSDAFSVSPSLFDDIDPVRRQVLATEVAVYYSLVTLTTLGYGDITPVSEAARMFSVMEALLGQIYLAVLVARLVGLHIATAGQRDD